MRISIPKIRSNLGLLILFIALFFFGNLLSTSAQILDEEDTQLWQDIQVAIPLSKEVDFDMYGTLRIGRDITHLVDRRIGTGFSFKVGKYLTLRPSYLNIVMRPSERRKINENRLSFPATLRLPLGKWLLTDRNLFERRLRFPLNSTRYRNRLQIEHPVKVGDMQLGLFASDEVFYDWSVDDWVRNRFAAGVSRKFNSHFTGELYYLRQNDGRSRPGDLHVIGVTYRVRL